MNAAVEQLRVAVEGLMREGRAEGIEPDGPLGRWLEAQVQALGGFAAVLDGQADRFEEVVGKVQAANDAELAKLSVTLELARETVKQGDIAVKQARNAQLAATVQQEDAVQRMIHETLPMFADRLKGALVIRESRWNRDKARRRHALAGLVFVGVFSAGYALCAWSDQDRLAAFDRCVAAPLQANGHTYCALDVAMAPVAASAAGAQGGS